MASCIKNVHDTTLTHHGPITRVCVVQTPWCAGGCLAVVAGH
jgi:hypothetical protein